MEAGLKTGFIIQARLSSTRFPGKLMQPFAGDDLLIDVILKKFLHLPAQYPVIVATTTNVNDNRLFNYLQNYPFGFFRGSEDNVLLRFIEAGKYYNLDYVVRVCADNPFFDVPGTLQLLDYLEAGDDYVAYKMENGLPTIKSHLGFWGEVVNMEALTKISGLTGERVYLEHVTNFIYNNPQIFNLRLIDAPGKIGNQDKLRFTLDSFDDYQLLKKLHKELIDEGIDLRPESIVDFINHSKDYKEQMEKQILIHSK